MRHAQTALLGLLLALGFSRPSARAATPKTETYRYTVVPGDTCWNIAEKLFGNGKKYKLIHQFNNLGPMPHILNPGQSLLLPRSGNIPAARVEWMRDDVKAKPPTSIDWLKAKARMSLWKLYKVSTGDNSSAGILFEDASFLQMRQRALLVIYGGSKTLARTKRMEKNDVVIERGIVKGGLASLVGKKPLLIKTPSSELKVLSKDVQVEVTETKRTIVGVHDGKVEVKAKNKVVTVPANHGTSVELGKAPEKPRRLPPRATWKDRSRRLVVFAPRGHTARFEVEWRASKQARRYHVELARNPRFRAPMVDAVVGAGVLKMRAQDLKPATYYARVAIIDRHRMEGRPSATLEVTVVPLQSSRTLRRKSDGTYETAGLLALSAPKTLAEKTEVSQNGAPFVSLAAPLRLSRPGLYTLRFRYRGSHEAQSAISVRVLRIVGQLSGPREPIHVNGGDVTIELVTRDESGEPIAPPGLGLRAYPGGALALVALGAGRYRATLKAPTSYSPRPIELWAYWAAGDLARVSLMIRKPAAPKKKIVILRRFSWFEDPVALEWGTPGLSLPARGARPLNRLELQSTYFRLRTPGVAQSDFLRMALNGSLALLSQRLGIDLELPFLSLALRGDTSGQSKLGDLRVGLRYLAYDSGRLRLTPLVRLSGPTGRYSRARNDYVLEAGLVVESQLRWVTLNSNQIVALDLDDRGGKVALNYSAHLSAMARFAKFVSFGVELQAVVGLLNRSAFGASNALLALTAGGALRLRFGRFGLSLNGGGALTRTSRELLGGFTVGLTLALGFAPL